MATSIIYGTHSVSALLREDAARVRAAWASPSCDAAIREALSQHSISVRKASPQELDRKSGGGRHQGIVVEANFPDALNDAGLKDLVRAKGSALVAVVLDGIQDPRNLGAALRTANAAGAHVVIIPKDRAARLTPAAVKAASGAALATPIARVSNLARTLRFLAEELVTVVGAAGEASDSLYGQDLAPPLAVVVGAEGGGLRRLTRDHCDQVVSIPMAGSVESLNVAAALAVILFEIRRQSL